MDKVKELREYFAPIILDIAEKFPLFGDYMVNPFDDIYDWGYECEYNQMTDEEREGFDVPVNLHREVLINDLYDYISDNYGRLTHGSYNMCLICDGGLGEKYVLKFCTDISNHGEPEGYVSQRIYKKAVEAGMQDYFAEYLSLDQLQLPNGRYTVPLFAAERCDNDEDYIESYPQSEEAEEISEDDVYSYEETFCGDEVTYLFLGNYAYADVEDLAEFIYNEGIRDIHSGNVGFRRSNNKPVIIDYAF